jgi:CRISPR-associated protein Cas1
MAKPDTQVSPGVQWPEKQPAARIGDAPLPVRNDEVDREAVSAAEVSDLAYCERLFHLRWVQGEGREETPGAVTAGHTRALSSETLGLAGQVATVEPPCDTRATPIRVKTGAVPDVAGGAYETDRVRLGVDALLLREAGATCDSGVLDFAEAGTRVVVTIDDSLTARVLALRDIARRHRREAEAPPPLVDSPKCNRCELAGLCLPDETNMISGREPEGAEMRRLMPARDDAAPLFVKTQGATVGVSGDCIVVRQRDEKLAEVRIMDVSSVACMGAVQVTTQALRQLLDRGVPVSYFSRSGWYYGQLGGLDHKNVLLRRAQFRVAFDAARSLDIARGLVANKIRNQRTVLRRNHSGGIDEALREMATMARRSEGAPDLATLLGLEGNAARVYFGAFGGMLKGPFAAVDGLYEGRSRRPPRDPVNAVLSFCYGVLTKDVTVTLQTMGFDALQGYFHQPRYGKPALALDLMEPFRPLIGDSVALAVLNTGAVQPGDFVRSTAGCAMNEGARKAVLEAYARRMDELVTHPLFGYRISYRRVVEVQARLLARHLTGEIDRLPEFRTR